MDEDIRFVAACDADKGGEGGRESKIFFGRMCSYDVDPGGVAPQLSWFIHALQIVDQKYLTHRLFMWKSVCSFSVDVHGSLPEACLAVLRQCPSKSLKLLFMRMFLTSATTITTKAPTLQLKPFPARVSHCYMTA